MKVLISDFDLTLYPEAYLDNIKRVNEFVSKGNIFIIATGRNLKSLANKLEGLDLKYSYLICNDGGVIYDKNHHIIHKTNINLDTAKEVLKLMYEFGNNPKIDNGYELDTEVKEEVNKLLIRYEDEAKAAKLLSDIVTNYSDVHGYLSTNYVNITNINTSKANAINYLEKLNNYQNIYVVGDNKNDISMFLKYYGYSIDTSIEEIRKLSKKHCHSFISVIDAIEKDV